LNVASRLFSLVVLVAAWYVGSEIAGQRMMPGPQTVGLALWAEAQSGALAFHLGATLARVAVAFVIAMAIGTALGVWMGRSRVADRLAKTLRKRAEEFPKATHIGLFAHGNEVHVLTTGGG